MAHLRELNNSCQRCHRLATVELLNRHNGSHGKFCSKCGKQALAELQESERHADKKPVFSA